MIIIIPLGGMGNRFRNAGYKKPKPLINVMGKPIIFWLLDNLKLEKINMVIMPYNNILEKYHFESLLKKKYPKINFLFISLKDQTEGATESIMKGLELLNSPDCPVLCMDGDSFYNYDIISHWNGENSVFYFEDSSDSVAYSFIKMNDKNIVDIAEKQRISNNASCGAYGFSSYQTLLKFCQEMIVNGLKEKNEYYLSGIIRLMINNGHPFIGKNVSINNYVCLGTPLDVRLFCNNYPKTNADGMQVIGLYRYCFDLDNTLVTYPKIAGDYTTVEPIQQLIDFLRYLKMMGHTIIIYTARRMNTCQGNVGKIMADIGKITLDTLEKFNIPYDELYFGKPYADYYIDDSSLVPYDDLEKELGFYKSTIDTRSFNTIVSDIIHTYKKIGNDLSGEIYWYTHMPNIIKDMFPLFLYSGENFYIMEKINGIPFSRLLLSEDLTLEHLKHIMNSINRIHNVSIPPEETNIDIYQNYYHKLEERYHNYNYGHFSDSDKIYQLLQTKLIEYQNKNMAKLSIVHGDTVLTNILINQFGKIKFIDMRGKLGKKLTICGDKFYDWAKLYQSLLGYDEILEGKIVSQNYKKKLLDYFENRFMNDFGNDYFYYLKYLTAGLFFSLIPLHHNDKCSKYYQLLLKIIYEMPYVNLQ